MAEMLQHISNMKKKSPILDNYQRIEILFYVYDTWVSIALKEEQVSSPVPENELKEVQE